MFNFPGEFKMFQEFVDERIEGDGATLFVRRAGPQGAPPLVLMPFQQLHCNILKT